MVIKEDFSRTYLGFGFLFSAGGKEDVCISCMFQADTYVTKHCKCGFVINTLSVNPFPTGT
jgi:hypothetical protein